MLPLSSRTADVAVDLGTSNTRIAVRGRGVVLDQPTAIAIQRGGRGREVIAVGEEARRMLGRTPAGTEVIRPLRAGVVYDFDATELLLRALLRQVSTRTMLRPKLLVAIPSDTTEVERRAVQESARAAGGRDVTLVSAPLVAALGADMPVREPVGSVIVDVGGGRTDVAVVSLGGLVQRRSVSVAGDSMEDAIRAWLEAEHNLQIGERTAENLKIRIGCAIAPHEPGHMRIRGRDRESSRPVELDVTAQEMSMALSGPVSRIREVLLETLAATAPELSSDIMDRGILLCGGGSLLRGLDEVLRNATGLPVMHVDAPTQCVIRGAHALLDDEELYARVTAI
jgi:rod shape-determining protein MreB